MTGAVFGAMLATAEKWPVWGLVVLLLIGLGGAAAWFFARLHEEGIKQADEADRRGTDSLLGDYLKEGIELLKSTGDPDRLPTSTSKDDPDKVRVKAEEWIKAVEKDIRTRMGNRLAWEFMSPVPEVSATTRILAEYPDHVAMLHCVARLREIKGLVAATIPDRFSLPNSEASEVSSSQ